MKGHPEAEVSLKNAILWLSDMTGGFGLTPLNLKSDWRSQYVRIDANSEGRSPSQLFLLEKGFPQCHINSSNDDSLFHSGRCASS
jgi:hypothetical protein